MPRPLIVGFGSIGRRHAQNLRTLGVSELSVFDTDPARCAQSERLVGATTFPSLEASLDGAPAVVFVCTPPSSHVPIALAAAGRNCHLFVEKPLTHDLTAGVVTLIDLVRQRHLVALVGCNMRFHPGLRQVKALIEAGSIGRVVAARVEVGQYLPDWHPWEDYRQTYSARRDLGGGVILDAIHELDYLRWMLGEVASVACIAGKLSHLDIETEDTAAIVLRFASGAIGEVHMDYVQRVYSRTCHIIGEEGTIRWDYSAGEVRWYSAATDAWRVFANPAGWEPNQMYLDEVRHLFDCLAGEAYPEQDIHTAAIVVRIALAARRSAAEGRSVAVSAEIGVS